MRTFDTGATRDSDDGKYDYEGFLSPLVLERYAQYMHKHRWQADGQLRDSDNWQKGIPATQYLKSKWRHFMDVWKQMRGYEGQDTLEDSLCADLFNTMGILHELIKARLAASDKSHFTGSREEAEAAACTCENGGDWHPVNGIVSICFQCGARVAWVSDTLYDIIPGVFEDAK